LKTKKGKISNLPMADKADVQGSLFLDVCQCPAFAYAVPLHKIFPLAASPAKRNL